MKRKDLTPGTVFTYVGYPTTVMWVPDGITAKPHDAHASYANSQRDEWDAEVDVIRMGAYPALQNIKPAIPTDSAERKRTPLCSGVLDYFTAALAEVAKVSWVGNDQHNPGQPLHWSRGKSRDHADCIMRHLAERGGFDGPVRHSAALAWRALALLQEELEAEGVVMSRGSKFDKEK